MNPNCLPLHRKANLNLQYIIMVLSSVLLNVRGGGVRKEKTYSTHIQSKQRIKVFEYFKFLFPFKCPSVRRRVFIQYSKVQFKLQNTLQLHWNDITSQLRNCLNEMEISLSIEPPFKYLTPLFTQNSTLTCTVLHFPHSCGTCVFY